MHDERLLFQHEGEASVFANIFHNTAATPDGAIWQLAWNFRVLQRKLPLGRLRVAK
jgi:hypothetical protein